MGYYTKYELRSMPNIIRTEDFIERFNIICGDYVLNYVLNYVLEE